FGLRLSEHILNINRDLGFDELQETYNLSGGYVFQEWEMHLTVFAPDFWRHIGSNETGIAAYYEHRLLDDHAAVGGQARVAVAPGITRFTIGALGKGYVEPLRTLLFAELDTVQLIFDDKTVDPRTQLVGAAGFTVLPVRGVTATLVGERT